MTEIFGSNPFEIVPHFAALVAAYLLALPVGWNREKEERSAGLRTFPLVAVAACGPVQAAEPLSAGHPEAMARIVEGIIAGMGFIGGGAILRQKDSATGTATAASLWATGAMGTAVGLGSYDVAVVLSPLKSELVEEPDAGEMRVPGEADGKGGSGGDGDSQDYPRESRLTTGHDAGSSSRPL